MFLGEAQMVGKLQHPNIVPIFDAGEEDGRRYIVTEHVHGARTLSRLLPAGQPAADRDVVSIIYKCAKALHYAHIARRRASRHQAVEHPADAGRRRAHRRFRHRAGRRFGYLAPRRHRGQSGVHVARTGAVPRNRRALRSVFARRRDVRDAVRASAVSRPARSASCCARSCRRLPEPLRRCGPRFRRSSRASSTGRCRRNPAKRYRNGTELAADLTRVHQKLRRSHAEIDDEERFAVLRTLQLLPRLLARRDPRSHARGRWQDCRAGRRHRCGQARWTIASTSSFPAASTVMPRRRDRRPDRMRAAVSARASLLGRHRAATR